MPKQGQFSNPRSYTDYRSRTADIIEELGNDPEGSTRGMDSAYSSVASSPIISSVLSDYVGSDTTSLTRDDASERSYRKASSTTRDRTEPMLLLNYNFFVSLVNSVSNKGPFPSRLVNELPGDLQNDIEFNDCGKELSTWTCTPSVGITSDEIPLQVGGYPVVLPVDYKYPLTGMFSPPPDPHHLFISPTAQLSDQDINLVFSTFSSCVGFYLLINGFLQVIMPDDFDYEEGIPNFPTEFGGLKVSLIPETVCPTAGDASASSQATTATSTRTRIERMFGQSSAQSSVTGSAGLPSATATGISVGSAIRAVVPDSKSKQRFEGKIGVAITPRDDNAKKYITVPTHILTDAVLASKTMSLDSDMWRKDVKVCVASNSVEVSHLLIFHL